MSALATRLSALLGTRYPIVQAPMAGRLTTPELVAAVSEAGALGSLAGAMLAPEELEQSIARIRTLTDRPFAVNLFAELPPVAPDASVVAAMNDVLDPIRAELGLDRPTTVPAPLPPGRVAAQIEVLVAARVPVFSFTFGLVPCEALQEVGCVVMGTATTVAEAVELERHGVDVVVAQGSEAGGHRGTFAGPFESALIGGMALVPQIVDQVSVPVVLAGGVMDGRGIAAALALGAAGAQLGTAFLTCDESPTPVTYRRGLREAHDDATTVTAAYSGRPARVIRSSLVDTIEESGATLLPYPLQTALAADVRTAALAADRADLLILLAGQGAGRVRAMPAGELVTTLVREAEETIRRLRDS